MTSNAFFLIFSFKMALQYINKILYNDNLYHHLSLYDKTFHAIENLYFYHHFAEILGYIYLSPKNTTYFLF